MSYAGHAGFIRPEMLADVREAFVQLEAAVSTAQPGRTRPFLGDALYEQVAGCVNELAAKGHRRVHGSFEIHRIDILEAVPPAQVQARVHATSSIARLDRLDRIVDGSSELKAWSQDVTVNLRENAPARPRWIITNLGDLTVEGDVTGPIHEPMHPSRRQALDDERRRREQESEEFWAALKTVSRNFLTVVGSAG